MKKMLLLLFLTTAVKVNAQSNQLGPAFQAYQKGNYQESLKLFTAYRQANPDDINGLLGIGSSLMKLGKYKSAISSIDSSFFYTPTRSQVNQANFVLAKCYSALNETDKALYYLSDAATHGNKGYSGLSDTLFKNVRAEKRFKTISEQLKVNSAPGLYDSRYKKMDYFIGIWDVFTGEKYDQKVAVDTVTQTSGGYSTIEKFKWTAGGNYTGFSMTFFDPATQKFRMCWAGSSGDIRNFEEIHSDENTMQLLAITNTAENELVHRRMTITYDPKAGTIHEYIENSADMGRTWVGNFDAVFKKAK
jgi:tetratricopeptide (TPR) repeat protein